MLSDKLFHFLIREIDSVVEITTPKHIVMGEEQPSLEAERQNPKQSIHKMFYNFFFALPLPGLFNPTVITQGVIYLLTFLGVILTFQKLI